MTSIQDSLNLQTPARRLASSAAPILIRVPALATGPRDSGRRVRRRRLRREVRLAAYFLLVALPLSIALAIFSKGDHRSAPIAAIPSIEVERSAPMIPAISISLEPALEAARVPEFAASSVPVFLSSQLLPADPAPPEETSHGGH